MTNKNWVDDIESLVDVDAKAHAGASRRDVLRGALGVGFAAAVLPVSANTISTPIAGLDTKEIQIKVDDEDVPVYVAKPEGKTTGMPVVLVISEIFGAHEHICDIARRFAREGYLAMAPELFIRQGDPMGYAQIADLIREVISKTPDEQVRRDLDACVAWAKQNGGDVSRLGITGFCWGGRQVWMYAASQPLVKAAVAWYGRLEGEPTPFTPQHPVQVADKIQAPVLGLYGGADRGISLESVERMKALLGDAGKKGNKAAAASAFVVYPDAPHAFHADYRPSYRKEAAQDGWQRCLAWFKTHGAA